MKQTETNNLNTPNMQILQRKKNLTTQDFLIYSCPMKMHHSSDAHICGLSKAVQNCVIYNSYRTNAMFSHKNFNSSDSVDTWRNASLKIVFIAFWAYTKWPQNLV